MGGAVDQLTSNWRECGLERGSAVLLHSSLYRTLVTFSVTPEEIFRSMLAAVGDSGTLVLPLFNFGFAEGEPFDIRNTPSKMGALTEVARRDPRSVRSGHPIYSFAAVGHMADRFDVDNFSGYGGESPFAVLRELGGKVAVLDLSDQNSMTFYHHVEEMLEVDYRYHKTFTGRYIDSEGEARDRSYGLFVRDIDRGVETRVDPMGELLWEQGLYRGARPFHESGLRTIDAGSLYDAVSSVVRSGSAEGLLYSIDPT